MFKLLVRRITPYPRLHDRQRRRPLPREISNKVHRLNGTLLRMIMSRIKLIKRRHRKSIITRTMNQLLTLNHRILSSRIRVLSNMTGNILLLRRNFTIMRTNFYRRLKQGILTIHLRPLTMKVTVNRPLLRHPIFRGFLNVRVRNSRLTETGPPLLGGITNNCVRRPNFQKSRRRTILHRRVTNQA